MDYERMFPRNEKTVINFDMDGTLAKWRSVPQWITKIPGYFLLLKPEKELVQMAKALFYSGRDVRILTAAYKKGTAKIEKRLWCILHGLGDLQFTAVPYGEEKSDYGNGILISDYTSELYRWMETNPENVAVKFYNGINGTVGRWAQDETRYSLHFKDSCLEMLKRLQPLLS